MKLHLIVSGFVTAALIMAVSGPAFADGTQGASDQPARTWGTNGRVSAVLSLGDSVILGGDFTSVEDVSGVDHPAMHLAKYYPATGKFDVDWSVTASTSGIVNALAASGDRLVVGGNFSKIGTRSHSSIGALSLSTGLFDPTFTTTVDKQVDSVAIVGSSVFLGGPFTTVTDDSGATQRGWLAKVDLSTGTLDRTWTPTLNGRVRALVGDSTGSKVYVGGDFQQVNGQSYAMRLTLLSTSSPATIDSTFRSGANNLSAKSPVYGLALAGSDLFVASAGSGGGCSKMNAGTGATQWSKHGTGDMVAVAVFGPNTYCGGHFSGAASFDGLTREKLAAVDTATGTTLPFAPVVNSALGVWSLGTTPDALLVGGDFTKIGSVLQPGFAQFRGLSARTVAGAPEGLSAVAGDGAVSLSWAPPSTDGGYQDGVYRVMRSTDGVNYSFVGGAAQPNFTDSSVINGTSYSYVVFVRNTAGNGPLSDSVVATPGPITTPPGAPASFHATGTFQASVLTWAAPSYDGGTPVTEYRVLRSTESGAESLLTSLPATARGYTDTDVVTQTRYYYMVQAVNAVGIGASTAEQSAVPSSGVPSAPVLQRDDSGTGVALSWTVASEGGSPVQKYVVVRDGVRIGVVLPPTMTIVDPSPPRGSHVYMVKAVNAIGTSKWSNQVIVAIP